MTYIKLEDAMRIFSNAHTDNNVNPNVSRLIIDGINSLPSIDFEEMINQEMDELDRTYATQTPEKTALQMEVLRSLLNKLPK